MNVKSFCTRKNKFLSCLLVLSTVVLFISPQVTHATSPSIFAISDNMSSVAISTGSTHTIKFTTGNTIQGTSSTIVVTFPSDFDFTNSAYSDITLTHGSSTGLENSSTISSSPSSGIWGAAFSGTNNRILTLSAPTSAESNPIASGDKVIISYTNSAHAVNGSSATTYLPTVEITGTGEAAGPVQYAIVLLSSDQVQVSATVDPYLTFSMTGSTITLTKAAGGNPTYSSGGTGYNQGTANTLTASTNGASGYSIAYYGDTLKSGSNSIAAMTVGAASSPGTAQFGINLKANSAPSTGTGVSGAGSGLPTSDYGTADNFKFVANASTPMAQATAVTAENTYTVSYIANIDPTTPAGAYTTTITYICTGNF